MNELLILLAIIVLASFLRFYKLQDRGLLFWDDGVRMREVLFLDDLVSFVRKNFKQLLSRKISLKEPALQFRGRYLLDSNPLNIFIYWLISKLTGNIEYSGLTANAFLGVFGVMGTFFLGNILGGVQVGLFSALVLSLSAYHLNYSRSVHAEICCGTFYVWATFFYLSSLFNQSLVLLAVSGILAGCSFASNSRQFYIPFFFVVYELFALLYLPLGEMIPRMMVLGTAMFLPVFIIEEAFLFLRAAGYPYPTYFMQLFERTGQNLSLDFRFPSFKLYAKTFFYSEGIFFMGLLLAGSIAVGRTLFFDKMLVLSQWVIPVFFWSMRPAQMQSVREGSYSSYNFALPRLASSAIYSMVMMIAFFFSSLSQSYFLIVLGIFALVALYKCYLILKVKAGYKTAIEFIKGQGDYAHISFCHPVSDFYMDGKNVIYFDMIKTDEDLESAYREKKARFFLYVPMLHQNVFKPLPVFYVRKIVSDLKPVFAVEHGIGQYWPFYCEDNVIDPVIMNPNLIEVYDLSRLYGEGAGGQKTVHAG